MGEHSHMRTICVLAVAFAAVALASEVEDLGAQPVAAKASLGEATKAKARSGVGFHGALMTSGSFTMMAAGAGMDEERRARRQRTSSARPTTGTSPTGASAKRARRL